MKKIILAVLLLLIGGAVAAPFLIGSTIQSEYTKRSELTQQQFDYAKQGNPLFKQLDLTLGDYDKGYLGASATSTLKLALNLPEEAGEKVYEIPMVSDIRHGPYLGDKGFGLANVVTKPKLEGLELPKWINSDTFTIETKMGFDRQLQQIVTMAPVSYSVEGAENGAKVEFAGATVDMTSPMDNYASGEGRMQIEGLTVVDSEDKQLFNMKPFGIDIKADGTEDFSSGTYSGKGDPITVNFDAGGDAPAEVNIASLTIDGEFKRSKSVALMLGKSNMALSDIKISNPAMLPKPINIPKFQASSGIEEADGDALNISMTQQVELGAELAELMQLPVAVKSALLTVNIDSFPISVVKQFQDVQRKSLLEPEEMPMSQEELTKVLQEIANNGSHLQLIVDAKAESGKLLADIDAGFRPGLDMSGSELMAIMNAPTPSSFLKLLVGKGEASLDKAVTDKAGVTPMLQMMLADFVTLEGETFKSTMQLKDGALLINGNPLPMLQ